MQKSKPPKVVLGAILKPIITALKDSVYLQAKKKHSKGKQDHN